MVGCRASADMLAVSVPILSVINQQPGCRSPVLGNSFNSLVFLFLDSTLFSYVKGRVGSPASGGTLFQDEAVLWCEERSDTMAYSMTTEYNILLFTQVGKDGHLGTDVPRCYRVLQY